MYTIERLTGAELVDAAGRITGSESTGHVISKHRTLAGARKAFSKLTGVNSRFAIFDAERTEIETCNES